MYKPPEIEHHMHRHLGEPTDVFSTGVLLFVMLSGRPPWVRSRVQDVRYRLFA